jgi:folate-binding protein YgfZ
MSRPAASAGILSLRGPDARTFLQGQLTNDVERLTETRLLPAAVANAQGRVLAAVRLLGMPDGALIWLSASEATALRAHFARFILRAKVEMRDESAGWRVLRLDAGAGEAPAALFPGALPDHGTVVRHGELLVTGLDAQGRIGILGPAEALAPVAAALEPSAKAGGSQELADIRSGWPDIQAETRALFVPQMLNLDLLGAISFRKGCYIGQEVIARTQHLGRIKRRMLRARGALAPPVPGTPVLARGEITGHVVRAAVDEHGACEMLATISIADRAQPLSVGSVVLERLSLPYTVPELDGPAPAG